MVMHPKLEKAMPLLEHLASGGKVTYKPNGMVMFVDRADLETILNNPSNYTIHREPRELWVNHYEGGSTLTYTTEECAKIGAKNSCSTPRPTTARYVEDLNWKPS
jgi:hypothetical protein